MKTIYLEEFNELAKTSVAYIPIGTVEWHGNVLPIETDFLVAQKICEELSKEYPGYVLPPIYMGAYGKDIIDGQEMRGMDRKLGKKLPGQVYFLKADLLIEILESLIDNLKAQGFSKIIIVTGHGGDNHEAALAQVGKDQNVLIVNPYDNVDVHHADEGEISILWACYPEEQGKASKDEDLINYYGYDPLEKSSLKYGQELLAKMLDYSKGKVKKLIESAPIESS